MTNYSNAKKSFNLQLKSYNPQSTVATSKIWLPPAKYGYHPQSRLPSAKYGCHPQSMVATRKVSLPDCCKQSLNHTLQLNDS